MLATRLLTLAAFCGVSAASQAGTLVADTFDTGLDGWQTANGATAPMYIATGGVTGGYISAKDTIYGTTLWYWTAPVAFTGNFSSAYGGSLSFSIEASRTTSGGESAPDVKITGNGITLAIDAGPNPGMGWTPYSVSFVPGAWHVGTLSSTTLATSAQIQSVLSDVTSLWIRGDYSPLTRGASSGLDNVFITTVPEPQTWALWLGGLLAVGSLVRRRQM